MLRKLVNIITMHCPLNYGAVLQVFSLQRYLEREGHNVKVIDYCPRFIVQDQSYTYIPDGPYKHCVIKRLLYIILKFPLKWKRKRIYRKFKKKYLHLTRRYKNYNELNINPPHGDVYFCGSDQIWSSANGAYLDDAYFLRFVKNGIKASYAASGHLPNPLTENIKDVLIPKIRELDFVSVREEEFKSIISPELASPIEVVVDPVFLNDRVFWKKFAHTSTKRNFSEKYVLLYIVGESEKAIAEASSFARDRGYKVYSISASLKRDARVSKYWLPNPQEFVKLFLQAQCVFTNSFHGTAFSIILEKPFWSFGAVIANTRISNLLTKAGLLNRYVSPEDSLKERGINEIDYAKANETLKCYITQSKEYINMVLNGEK